MITTKIGWAKSGTKSIKTTIPQSIIEFMEINNGDEIVWTMVTSVDGIRSAKISKREDTIG